MILPKNTILLFGSNGRILANERITRLEVNQVYDNPGYTVIGNYGTNRTGRPVIVASHNTNL
jgi:hypothetical protein